MVCVIAAAGPYTATNKGPVFNHCQKRLQTHALNDIGHQRKQIITASDRVTICVGHNPHVPGGTCGSGSRGPGGGGGGGKAVKLLRRNHKELWPHWTLNCFNRPITGNEVTTLRRLCCRRAGGE